MLLAGAPAGFAFLTNQGSEALTSHLDAPLDDITEAKVDINVGDGNRPSDVAVFHGNIDPGRISFME